MALFLLFKLQSSLIINNTMGFHLLCIEAILFFGPTGMYIFIHMHHHNPVGFVYL